MDNENDKTSIEAFVETFQQNFLNEEYVNNVGIIDMFISDSGENPSFSEFQVKTREYTEDQKHAIVNYLAMKNGVKREEKYLYVGMYLHYAFLKSHMRTLLTDCEGSFACVDKFNTLMRLYKQHLIHGEFKIPETKEYYHPVLSSIVLWMDMITALIRLHAASNEMYLLKLSELEKMYSEIDEDSKISDSY